MIAGIPFIARQSCSPSLVPGPFPPPVLDHLQCANTRGGKAWEIWSRAMTPDATAHDQISQALPSVFAYCK